LLQSPGAIAVTARPRLRTVQIAAILAIVRVLDAEQLEIFLPIRPLLRQRRRTETGLHPVRHAVVTDVAAADVVTAASETLSENAIAPASARWRGRYRVDIDPPARIVALVRTHPDTSDV